MALFCLGTLVPAAFAAADQYRYLATWWLVAIGGGIVAAAAAMLIASFAGHSPRWFQLGYVLVVSVGLLSWPLAWQADQPTHSTPWLWMCLGVAAICLAAAVGTGWGLAYAIVSGVVFAAVQIGPAGQNLTLLSAAQDLIVLVVNAAAVIAVLAVLHSSFAELDDAELLSRKETTEAVIEQALLAERNRLDGIVHDEVMTTLVAAAHSGNEPAVAAQARRAIDRLAEVDANSEPRLAVTGRQLTWLVTDVVSALVPQARIHSELSDDLLPQPVASTIGLVAREVAANIARHAAADEVEVRLSAPAAGTVQVLISDDGIGFDPAQVPQRRLGLHVSVVQRMRTIGGTAEIDSAPGQGTRIALSWTAPRPVDDDGQRGRSRGLPAELAVSRPVLIGLVWLLIGLQLALGWTSLGQLRMIWPVLLAQVLAVIATAIALAGDLDRPITGVAAITTVGLLLVLSSIVASVLPEGSWPGYATWHASVVMVLLVVVLIRGQGQIAWIGAGLYAVLSVAWALVQGIGLGDTARAGFSPLAWLLVAQLVQGWLIDLGERLAVSRRSSAAARQAIARSFSQLVLREIWLARLREQVGPLLDRIADAGHHLSDQERAACLAAEGRLREAMVAGGLVTELTAEAIQLARERGVDVRLVDSRGSRLPNRVRLALTQHLHRVLADASTAKVVARAAPVGYEDVVTVLAVRQDGSSELVGLDVTGRVTTR